MPAQLVYYLLAKEFGVPPWVVADAPAGDVFQAIEIYALVKEGEAVRAKIQNSKRRSHS
ncbi:hypothetical protein UFOVP613_34 [uncultured Caudovirales phage]|jgi:hydrogenase maturation factor|uniref:Uncharacterized protein n=1 Tax=uncultured Caudovirales phage TaxID=2100421 RepID=A0A6J5N2A6_9CAUD|nr:hypothetical protein UFOVP613_34 [uncultured Caudovirales phage]